MRNDFASYDIKDRPEHESARTVLLVAVFLCLCLPFLGAPPLMDPDEGYYPSTAREMMAREGWFDPVFNSGPRWGKPIGFYLAECISFRVLGATEFSARLPSLLAGLGLMLLSAGLGRLLFGRKAAFFSGLVCATSLQTVVYSRAAVPDMLLAVFICLALYGFVLWDLRGRSEKGRGGPVLALMYLGCALGFLVKGPLGVLLPGITVMAFLVFSKRLKDVSKLGLWWGIPLFLLVTAPWFVYMYCIHGTAYLEEFFLHRNLERYFTDRWEHPGPVWYYLPILAAGSFPWTLVLAGAAVRSLKGLAAGRSAENDPGDNSNKKAHLLLWCWLGGMLLFFSFSRSKLLNYVLPLYPVVAVLCGSWLAEAEKKVGRVPLLIVAGGTAVLALSLLAASLALLPGRLDAPFYMVATGLWPVALIVPGAAFWLLSDTPGKSLRVFCACCALVMALVFAMTAGFVLPRLDQYRAVRSFGLNQLAGLGDGERICCLQVWTPSLLFYTGSGRGKNKGEQNKGKIIRFDPYRDSWEDFIAGGGRWVLTRERSLALADSLMGGRRPAKIHRIGDRILLQLADINP